MPPVEPPAGPDSTVRPVPSAPPTGFHHLGDEMRLRGWRISVVRSTFSAPDGTVFTRDVVRHPGAVAVVPVTDDGTVLLVSQYRGAVGRELLEIPAGTRDVEGEPPESTARREVEEEVGVRAGTILHLATLANSPGFCDEITLIYLATALEPVPTDRHGEEETHMTVVELPLTEACAMIGRGEVVDAQTVAGLLLARDHLDGGARPRRP
ncbi:MAG TPA: NUDIX hydrolase [Acidimicrobiales bacterium]|nr:NUDIX hydrolase [Acidimicrobiales bacterium]